jgi:hypothetical protein
MKTLKRIKLALSANVEGFINEVENQQGIIEAAIKEVKSSLLQINIQINNTERKIISDKNKIKEVQESINVWTIRAKETYLTDKSQAMDCTRRVVSKKKELAHFEFKITESKKIHNLLHTDKDLVVKKLQEIQSKQSLMISRESKNDALYSGGLNNNNSDFIEDVFNRWDDKLVKSESYNSNASESVDTSDCLEEHYINQEEEKILEEEFKSITTDD